MLRAVKIVTLVGRYSISALTVEHSGLLRDQRNLSLTSLKTLNASTGYENNPKISKYSYLYYIAFGLYSVTRITALLEISEIKY